MLSFPDITLEGMEALMARVAPTLVEEGEGEAPVVITVRFCGFGW